MSRSGQDPQRLAKGHGQFMDTPLGLRTNFMNNPLKDNDDRDPRATVDWLMACFWECRGLGQLPGAT